MSVNTYSYWRDINEIYDSIGINYISEKDNNLAFAKWIIAENKINILDKLSSLKINNLIISSCMQKIKDNIIDLLSTFNSSMPRSTTFLRSCIVDLSNVSFWIRISIYKNYHNRMTLDLDIVFIR